VNGFFAPVDGVFSLLAFLRRRGYALGLLSNLSSVHKEPVAGFGMEAMVDAAGFSCDTGVTKPDPRAYLDLWRRSGFLLKQQFYASARALVMISAYSMEVVWPAIGYDGPLLPRRRT